MRSLADRFWSKVEKTETCWPWRGGTQSAGYGWFNRKLAHRLAWELANGRPPPRDQMVCHSCDNPLCVNPAHLFLGSAADNARDRDEKGRGACGARNGAAKLSDEAVFYIRYWAGSGMRTVRQLAEEYRISETQVRDVIAGRYWRHVGGAVSERQAA